MVTKGKMTKEEVIITFVNSTSIAHAIFPEVWVGIDVGLNGLDLVVATILLDIKVREGLSIGQIHELLDKTLGPFRWEQERDVLFRHSEIFGYKTLLKT